MSLENRKRKITYRFLALFLLGAATASLNVTSTHAYTTNTNIYTPPDYLTFQPPAAGGSYTDPVFGSPIKRLSNAMKMTRADGGGAMPFVAPEYSTMSPFNQDNSRLLLVHFSYFGLYDGAGNFLKELPSIDASEEPRWSRRDPNVFYYHKSNQLRSYNVGSDTSSVVHTFSQYSSISGMGESDISLDGDHFVLAGDRRYIFVYEISTDSTGGVLDANGHGFDSLYITPRNNVTVTWFTNGNGTRFTGIEFFDRNMNFQRQLAHAGGHMDVTTDLNGDEVLVWVASGDPQPQTNCNAGVVKIRLADARQTCIWRADWSMALHVTAPDNSGWFFAETYVPSDPIPPNGWLTYTDELVQVKLDGSEVRRLAHHRSRPLNSYTYQPKTSSSRDGTKIAFGSNFGLQKILGYPTEYGDAYMIDVGSSGTGSPAPPPTPDPTPTPTPTPTPAPPTPTPTPTPSPTPGATRVEETNSAVVWSGTWRQNNSPSNSTGSARLSRTAGSRASFTCTGTDVTWIGHKDQWSGIARVSIDGALKATVDTYAPTSGAQAQVGLYTANGLPSGTHTIAIEVTGTKGNSARAAWVWVDAFDYIGTSLPSSSSANAVSAPVAVAGGRTLTSNGAGPLLVGSGRIDAGAGGTAPSGLAILDYRQNGILISETGVPASVPALKGRIFVEIGTGVNTGFAIANPNDTAAKVSFFYTDRSGTDSAAGTLTIPAHGQIARFLNEAPFSLPQSAVGTFTFSSDVPISATALRGLVNKRSEFLMTTLPVADLEELSPATTFLPLVADGGGWSTQFALVNPSDDRISGTMSYFGQTTAYSIAPRSSYTVTTANNASQITVGPAQVTPDLGNIAPVGVGIFSFKLAGITVSEAGVPSQSIGNAFRMYAEVVGTSRTGIAIQNTGATATHVRLELSRLDGTRLALAGNLDIPAFGQRSLFLNEVPGLESIPNPFQGIVRVSTTDLGTISVLGLRGRTNERGDFLITTTPAVDENAATHSQIMFPQTVNGGGYQTQFVFFSATPAEPASGDLRLFTQTGGT